jgi:hypothetical protein
MSVGKGANTLDLAGRRFGRWVVLSWAGTDAQRGATWLCRCACGTEKVVRRRNLVVPGQTVSCGCHRVDLRKGVAFASKEPMGVPPPKRIMPLKAPQAPRTAETRKWAPDSPGRAALRAQRLDNPNPLFTTQTHGLSKTPEYQSWKKMMGRCYKEDDQDFAYYGGRGIKVCDQWHNVESFIADMGAKREGFSVERIDVDGDYEMANCYWMPHRLQPKNRRPWKHSQEGLARIAEGQRKRHAK